MSDIHLYTQNQRTWALCRFNAEEKVSLLTWAINLCKIKADRYKNRR